MAFSFAEVVEDGVVRSSVVVGDDAVRGVVGRGRAGLGALMAELGARMAEARAVRTVEVREARVVRTVEVREARGSGGMERGAERAVPVAAGTAPRKMVYSLYPPVNNHTSQRSGGNHTTSHHPTARSPQLRHSPRKQPPQLRRCSRWYISCSGIGSTP